jgi:hypothetical protein
LAAGLDVAGGDLARLTFFALDLAFAFVLVFLALAFVLAFAFALVFVLAFAFADFDFFLATTCNLPLLGMAVGQVACRRLAVTKTNEQVWTGDRKYSR